jgi:polysaccharide export outer membrane protein
MRIARIALILAAYFFSQAFAQQPSVPELSSYKLAAGDVITVRVLGEEDLKREKVRLSDAGTMSFPVLGEINVRGMTVGALEDYITKSLKGRYLLNPQVTVSVDEYRNFYVNGMVEKPADIPSRPGSRCARRSPSRGASRSAPRVRRSISSGTTTRSRFPAKWT